MPLIEMEWGKAGFIPTRHRRPEEVLAAIGSCKPRARSLTDFAPLLAPTSVTSLPFDPAAVTKFIKDAATRDLLVELGGRYERRLRVHRDICRAGAARLRRGEGREAGHC